MDREELAQKVLFLTEEKCVLCGKEIKGWGNNPSPLREEGRCCDNCNYKVITQRLRDVSSGRCK